MSTLTRTCPDCATPLEPGERFCGGCGAYAEWGADGSEPAFEPSSPPPAAAPPAAPSPEAAPPAEPKPAPPPAAEHPPSGAAELLVPVDKPKPVAQQPAPQQPGPPAAKPRDRRSSVDAVPIGHGDLICGDCGAGNAPTRKFCRRCGHSLAEAEVAKVPWWRRWKARRRKAQYVESQRIQSQPSESKSSESKRGGSRRRSSMRGPTTSDLMYGPRMPRMPRLPRGLIMLLAILGIGIGGTYMLRGHAGGAYDQFADRVFGVEQVNPALSASDSLSGHGAKLARDGNTNRYWAPEKPGPSRGTFLVAKFEKPVRLVYMVITPGVSGEDEGAFLKQGRPAELRATYTREGAEPEVETIEFEDKMGTVEFGVGVSDVTQVKLEIRKSYEGEKQTWYTAIGEVEFQVRG